MISSVSSGMSLAFGSQLSQRHRELVRTTRRSQFSSELETHLSEVEKQIRKPYSAAPSILNKKSSSTSETLGHSDPDSLTRYSGYLTALSYDKRARFANGLADSVELSRSLHAIA